MNDSSDRSPPAMKERRSDRSGRGHSSGETTAFEIAEISRAIGNAPRPLVPLFVVVSGVQRGRPFVIDAAQQSVGRGPGCDISLSGRGISRTHLWLGWDMPRHAVTARDADSTNGVFLNGRRIREQVLREGDVVYLGPETAIRLEFCPDTDAMLRVRQYENSIVDELTGIHNRRYLMSSLEHEMAFARRHGQNLSLLLVDIDHFKRVNDEHGHQVGDAVIQQIAALVAESLRTEDNFARLGGEEFAIVSRGLTRDTTAQLAERLRASVQARSFRHQQVTVKCTVSIGGAVARGVDDTEVSAFIKQADENLYEAKNGGRNRTVIG